MLHEILNVFVFRCVCYAIHEEQRKFKTDRNETDVAKDFR